MESFADNIIFKTPQQLPIDEVKYYSRTTLSIASAWSIVYRLNEIKNDSQIYKYICEDIINDFLFVVCVNDTTQKNMCKFFLGGLYKGKYGEIPIHITMNELRHDTIYIKNCIDVQQLVIALRQRIKHITGSYLKDSYAANPYYNQVYIVFKNMLQSFLHKLSVHKESFTKSPISPVPLIDKSRDPRLRKRENKRIQDETNVRGDDRKLESEPRTAKRTHDETIARDDDRKLEAEPSTAKRICAPEPIVIPEYDSKKQPEITEKQSEITEKQSEIIEKQPINVSTIEVVPVTESATIKKEKIFSEFVLTCFKNGISLNEFFDYIKTK
jgi:hypothetical protein